ncbi:Acyl-CoA dehydrogenase family member 9, mitochondrial [Hypsibius exemplaris]|uniref:Acyl-CoA dehydrogenase family member 9, mitochondrial n=1 Tax=Hypsibius exemplaris TaxID=2072580 RepID=A0A1W0X6Q0_HYPEX|nr:Acyl-CoA dehydrogenase family member 9, mitochondrial [Hypsibius exemplaris]
MQAAVRRTRLRPLQSLLSSRTILHHHPPQNNTPAFADCGARGVAIETAVGVRISQQKNDEFAIIKEKTRQLLERPKKHRDPFIKNLFLKKIDPTILEYPEVRQDEMDELMNQVEPIANRVKEVDPEKIDKNGAITEDVLTGVRNSGGFVHRIPRTHRGNDLNMVGYTAVVEALSLEGNMSLGALAYTMGSWSARTLEKHGTEEQKAFYLPMIATGEAAFSLCVSEEKTGSNVAAMQTSVRLGEDNRGYLIKGKKSWVINAPNTDYFIVIAKHQGLGEDVKYSDPERQFHQDKRKTGSMSAFIVPKKAPGVTVGQLKPFIGLRGLQVSELILDDVPIPLDYLIGKTGDGFGIAMEAVSMERHVMGAVLLPLLKKLIDQAAKYVSDRHVFNRPLSDFHMIRDKLTEAAYLVYALESMTYLTSLLIDTTIKPEFDLESAAVRAFAADIAPRVVRNLMEIYGASGVTHDRSFDQALRDILTFSDIDGGTDVARLYIALSGYQYAGLAQLSDIQKLSNPFAHPQAALRRSLQSLGIKRAAKRTVYLDDYVHPTLQNFAYMLETCCTEFGQCAEGLLYEYNKDLVNRQVELKQTAEMATLIYASFAVLGRCSRAYCVGMKHNKQEMNLAALFFYYAKRRIHSIWEEIGSGPDVKGRESMMHEAAVHMVTERSYGWVNSDSEPISESRFGAVESRAGPCVEYIRDPTPGVTRIDDSGDSGVCSESESTNLIPIRLGARIVKTFP